MRAIFLAVLFLLQSPACLAADRPETLDDFDTTDGWTKINSDESVQIQTQAVPGKEGQALRMGFQFTMGTGFCGIQKQFPKELPENFQFTFYLKGDAPVSNFEFKLLDESGDNVWWRHLRNYEFHREWRKITIKKRDIEFAWGPIEDRSLKKIDKIQFFVTSATGGAGTVDFDSFTFEELPAPDPNPPNPLAEASSEEEEFAASHIFDKNLSSEWRNLKDDPTPEVTIDLQKHYEYGGIAIDWDAQAFASSYEVFFSHDRRDWQLAYRVERGKGGRAYLPLKDFASRYLKLKLLESNTPGSFAIKEIDIKSYAFVESPESMYREIAKDHLRGFFPRYFRDEQSYWTVTGVNNDRDEALLNEDGMVEVDKSLFSIEPFLFLADGRFLTWNDVQRSQHLEEDYLPIPSVQWRSDGLSLESKIFADGPAGESVLYLQYTLRNKAETAKNGNLYLAIRPFQVNPPWQFLNWPGGTARIHSVKNESDKVLVDDKEIFKLTNPDAFGAADFDEGDITYFMSRGSLPERQQVSDAKGFASAALKYAFSLSPGQEKQIVLAIPFHENSTHMVSRGDRVVDRLQAVREFWREKINTVHFDLPKSADRLINTLRSNLAYILINRDGFGIQPGSRSYERSWIRDGSLTSSALLKLGVQEEVKDFIDWYADYQYPNGAVPCVVDTRGPDPVPEHDSHGQLIFALMQYYLFTGDKEFLREHFTHVQKSVEHMNDLTAQRKTDIYRNGTPTQRASYGLLPESISHEGYSSKPMHSYWDDFFGLKGYKDAVEIAKILGETEQARNFVVARDEFHTNLYNSIRRAVQNKGIDFIPGCVELGDFDATSTAIAIYPVNELKNLPQPYAQNTFDRYFNFFQSRRDGGIEWKDYTPYEVRLIGTFIYLGQVERAHALIDFFFDDQRPSSWNHWAEVVRNGYDTTGFIGDMPHTWVGSDFISALRSMFVYEDELNRSLVVGAGLYQDWLDTSDGMAVKNLPTYYGKLDYAIKKLSAKEYSVSLEGSLKMPAGHIVLRNRWGKTPKTVFVNGKKTADFDHQQIVVKDFPAKIRVIFQ